MGLAPVWRLRKGARSTAAPSGPEEHAARSPSTPPVQTRRSQSAGRPAAAATTSMVVDPREEQVLRMDWTTLKAKVAGCTDCRLRATCKQTVFGVGDERAAWMLVGEAPGSEEDRLGEPFVGQAGKLLDNMLAAIGLKRGDNVYVANVLKCRPPGNRNPEPDEVARCSPYLARQIELIGPKLVVAMGRFAAQTLLNSDATIASLRGSVHRYAGVPVVVTYHPAYLLRNLPDKAKAWADLRFAVKTMQGFS
ncbi:MAG: uracil-DNA glycosylase [Betaproteobacteria bacterium]|nr:uracil-DNA glycosylase [Betaproteobacteria bacterium]